MAQDGKAMTYPNQWQILIVENHAVYRATLHAVLATDAQFHIIAEASSATEALALMASVAADLILIAMYLPDINGLLAAEQIKAKYSQAVIFILSSDWSPAYERRAKIIGIDGRLAKQEFSISNLREALQQIAKPSRF